MSGSQHEYSVIALLELTIIATGAPFQLQECAISPALLCS